MTLNNGNDDKKIPDHNSAADGDNNQDLEGTGGSHASGSKHGNAINGSAAPVKKKKKRKRVIDKAKVAENKKKAKARKRRQKEQLKKEKARIKAERQKGKVLEESVKLEESVTVNDRGAVERTITVEET
ncbi:MAG: hypothetical protein K2P66_03560, partial [Lachnospiraceae bacterium]|nr:hypothetical protein [Lachnospiraceae bacterium]